MTVTIGIRGVTRELRLDLNLSADELHQLISEATTQQTPIKLTETNGNVVIIPAKALGFVQIAEEKVRKVGFTVG